MSNLQSIGANAYASIAQMVERLDPDFWERLEELREMEDRTPEDDAELAQMEATREHCEDDEDALEAVREDALSVEVLSTGWPGFTLIDHIFVNHLAPQGVQTVPVDFVCDSRFNEVIAHVGFSTVCIFQVIGGAPHARRRGRGVGGGAGFEFKLVPACIAGAAAHCSGPDRCANEPVARAGHGIARFHTVG